MDIYFTDPNEVPLPPEEVRIRELRAEPWEDGRRVHVYLELDPSQQRPNADLLIMDEGERVFAATSIIESIERRIELTMHLRAANPGGRYQLSATVFFAKIPEEPSAEQGQDPVQKTVVDERRVWFEIAQP
jgi:hypothetical protein